MLQLNWVYDEYFALPAVWREVFLPFGIGCLPVLNHRTGDELQTVVQLEITEIAPSPLSIGDEYPSEVCGSCGRRKYVPITRGFFPSFAKGPSFPICRTQEYFGSGASGWRAIVSDRAVCRAVRAHKLSGVTFVPLRR